MTELQVGQPALVINVELEENRHLIGKCITVIGLHSKEEAQMVLGKEHANEPYATHRCHGGLGRRWIRQRYLMPIPPLDDDILEQTNIKQPEGETA